MMQEIAVGANGHATLWHPETTIMRSNQPGCDFLSRRSLSTAEHNGGVNLEMVIPGNANLLIGVHELATQESGVPSATQP